MFLYRWFATSTQWDSNCGDTEVNKVFSKFVVFASVHQMSSSGGKIVLVSLKAVNLGPLLYCLNSIVKSILSDFNIVDCVQHVH
jgi:hypothetical protein